MNLERFRPSTLSEYGKTQDVTIVKNFLESWLREAPLADALLLHGPPGTGKTTLVRCLARSYGCQLVDWNASSQVNADTIDKMHQASLSDSWGEKPKLIFLDEVDHVSTRYQRKLASVIEESAHPVILACNHYDEVQDALRESCLNIEFARPDKAQLERLARKINQADGDGSVTSQDIQKASTFRELIARAEGSADFHSRSDDFDARIRELLRGGDADLRPSEFHLAKAWLMDNSNGTEARRYDEWLERYKEIGKPAEKYLLRAARSVQRTATSPEFPWSVMVEGEDDDGQDEQATTTNGHREDSSSADEQAGDDEESEGADATAFF